MKLFRSWLELIEEAVVSKTNLQQFGAFMSKRGGGGEGFLSLTGPRNLFNLIDY